MTVEYTIDKNCKLVLVTIAETVTFDELIEHLTALSQDIRYQPPMKKLVDFRKCGKYGLTKEQAEEFAGVNRELGNIFVDEKCAIVAPGDLEYGMSRVHEMYVSGSGIDIQVFRQLPEALEWLQVPGSRIE